MDRGDVLAPSSSCSVAALTASDFDAWLPLWQGYLRFYETDLSEAMTRLTFARLTGGAEPMGGFLARDASGRPVGFVTWLDHRSTWTEVGYCYLEDLYVDTPARGAGVGRALIEAVYDHARAAGRTRVYWMTNETNLTAQKLYDRVAEKSAFVQYRKTF